MLVKGSGGPLSICISGANVNDAHLLATTLDAIVVERPQPSEQEPQHLCLDKGYDNPTGHQVTQEAGYTPHIRRVGEKRKTARATKPVRLANGWSSAPLPG